MSSTSDRGRRVGELMQRELAALIQQELKDPRLGMITVAAVKLSRDLVHARVFVTVLSDEREQIEQSISGLQRASSFLRRELGRRMQLRHLPELSFVHDTSVAHGAHMSALIEQAVAADNKTRN
jgi:ribosome-binding factor A